MNRLVQERRTLIRKGFLIRGDLVLVHVFPDAGNPEKARNQQEDGEVDQQGDAQEVEGDKVEDGDGQRDHADVEAPLMKRKRKREQKVLTRWTLSFKVFLSFWQQVVGSSSSSLLWKVSSSVHTLITTRKLIWEIRMKTVNNTHPCFRYNASNANSYN